MFKLLGDQRHQFAARWANGEEMSVKDQAYCTAIGDIIEMTVNERGEIVNRNIREAYRDNEQRSEDEAEG